MNCNNCVMGAPYYLCFYKFCKNYEIKEQQERQWEKLMQEMDINETKGNN